MQTSKTYFPKQNAIHVAFSPDRLETLISQGKLHAADFNCLDKKSKRTVWSMLLAAAAHRLG